MDEVAGLSPAFLHIPLSKGYVAIVDKHNHEWLSKMSWHAEDNQHGGFIARHRYRCDDYTGKRVRSKVMSRLIMEKKLGRKLASIEVVDHKNGDTLDNLESNLRLCSNPQNVKNRRKVSETNPYKGITLLPDGRWRAGIRAEEVGRSLGVYTLPEDAARAYDAAARFYYGEFARTNFEGTEALSYEELRKRAKQSNMQKFTRGITKYRGVSKDKSRFVALIRVEKKTVRVSTHATELEAAIARDDAVHAHGLNVPLNFPERFAAPAPP